MNDRGMIKWAPFNSVINGDTVKKEIRSEKNRIQKPILSEEQIMDNERLILECYKDNIDIRILYYFNYDNKYIEGKITKIDNITKNITINGTKIYFYNIIRIYKKMLDN